MSGWRLVADVGGTNVRFARALADGRLADHVQHRVSGFTDFTDALRAYLEDLDAPEDCAGAAVAGAGPVLDDRIALTNLAWSIRREAVSAVLDGVPVALFNDLQAAALSIPHLDEGDLVPVLDGATDPTATRLAVNVGTGFGASMLVRAGEGWVAMPTEAGHMTFAATTPGELELAQAEDPSFRCVEDALSGPGLVRLHAHFLAKAGGGTATGEVFDRVEADPAAGQAAEAFSALLGRICGDLVLATAAWGGLHLFGSVTRAWHARADAALFRRGFREKEKMTARMAGVPVHLVTNDLAPLIGLARGA